MIVLDTNVLFTTAMSRGEMPYGTYLLPANPRRDEMRQEIKAIFSIDVAGRVLPYAEAAADAHAELAALRRTQGRPGSQSDLRRAQHAGPKPSQECQHQR